MLIKNTIYACTMSSLIITALTISTPVYSRDAGAFIGGVVTAKVLGNMKRRTAAEEEQAANSAQPVQQAAPAPAPAGQTTQQKLDQLDKLAAGGYITADQYKAKKQSIIDSM